MGLFARKTYTCEKCGKQYEKRINLNGNLCDECWSKEMDEKHRLEKETSGYIRYAEDVMHLTYTNEDLKNIIELRDTLLAKYKNNLGITREELRRASEAYKSLTDEQAEEILNKLSFSSVKITMGAAYSSDFFALTNYEGVFVDADDVVAAGYTSAYGLSDGDREAILCIVFTKNPFIPVFPVVYSGKMSFFSLKSKKGRESVSAMFGYICPNLVYEVEDIKCLKKNIKQNGVVGCNLDAEFMLDQISNASLGKGLFSSKKMSDYLPYKSAEMLDQMGYIQESEISSILKLDKMFNRNYWKKQMKRITDRN